MQCLQLYPKDSARAWLRGLPKKIVDADEPECGRYYKTTAETKKNALE
jgi:hypothetical protein